MISLESELAVIYSLIERATATGDDATLRALLERKETICAVLVALDQAQ